MFNFGLFSSSIPYIVFVAAYLFFFSVQVFGREPETACREDEIATSSRFFSNEKIIYLNEEEVGEEIRKNKQEALFPLPFIKELQPECIGQPYFGVTIRNFSRPPPSLTFSVGYAKLL